MVHRHWDIIHLQAQAPHPPGSARRVAMMRMNDPCRLGLNCRELALSPAALLPIEIRKAEFLAAQANDFDFPAELGRNLGIVGGAE